MLGIGAGELLMILVIAVMVVGPERMVEFAGQAGRWLAKFRQMTEGVTKEFQEALSLDEIKAALNETTVDPEATGVQGTATNAVAIPSGEAVLAIPAPADQMAVPGAPVMAVPLVAVPTPIDGETEPAIGWLVGGDGASEQDAGSELTPVPIQVAELVPEDVDVLPTIIEQAELVVDEVVPAAPAEGLSENDER